jgi:UDP-2,4-diacetamido-2,4,6-trideoxy-beta-L-altropyranose hydrolase
MDISIRNAEKKDSVLLFNWFNAVDSLKFKIKTQKRISIKNHNKWFDERLLDIKTYIWIIQDKNNNPIGQIRFQKLDEKFYDIDIYIARENRKKGIASKALSLAENKAGVKPLRAIVNNYNNTSRVFFLKNGFKINLENKSFIQLVRN